ncbi:MAG: hypothetical protein NTV34_06850, partial [Proteobacteria bacterium]|nr:hypothetical protein [Pseudomonadota bacterium]
KLVKIKLLEICDGKIKSTNAAVHMDKNSPMSSMHHLNWRNKVVESFCSRQPEDLHYTGVHSLSANDLAELKIKINRLLTEFNGTVSASPEERVAVVVMDVFEL